MEEKKNGTVSTCPPKRDSFKCPHCRELLKRSGSSVTVKWTVVGGVFLGLFVLVAGLGFGLAVGLKGTDSPGLSGVGLPGGSSSWTIVELRIWQPGYLGSADGSLPVSVYSKPGATAFGGKLIATRARGRSHPCTVLNWARCGSGAPTRNYFLVETPSGLTGWVAGPFLFRDRDLARHWVPDPATGEP
jgi:hypothetical protein